MSRWDWIGRAATGLASLAVLTGGTAALSASAILPGVASRYYLMLPGEAFPVAPRIVVPPERRREVGDLYLTVAYEQAADPPFALAAASRYGVRVVPYEDVVPRDQTEEQANLQFRRDMDESQLTAALVALRRAGFDVRSTGRGARVTGIVAGMPAEGILRRGDVAVGFGGQAISTVDDLTRAMRGVRPGDEVALTVRRDGGDQVVRIRTSHPADEPARAAIGVFLQTDGLETNLPFPVRIEERVVGGPSAGLMFALGIYDAVTPGRLGDGRRVAGTGTIDREGRVGPVAGIAQKALGAQAAGAEVFLVPADNVADLRELSTTLAMVPVRTFDEALAALGQ